MDIQFSPVLWECLDNFYDEEWEAYLRPTPGPVLNAPVPGVVITPFFDWQYAVFYEDKCLNCPLIWKANTNVLVTGFELKLTTGHIFKNMTEIMPFDMKAGDTLSFDQFIVPRTNNTYGY